MMEFNKETAAKTATSLVLSLTMLGVLIANVIPESDSRIEITGKTEETLKHTTAEADYSEPDTIPLPQTTVSITTKTATEESAAFEEQDKALVSTAEFSSTATEEKQPDRTTPYTPQTTATSANTIDDQKNERININTATKEELMELDGIGEVKAQAIIDYRTKYGDFVSIDELTEVKGIGEKTLEKNRDRITI